MADDSYDFLSSPIAQLLIPLASAAAGAISPRYGGAAVQGGLGAIGALQNYKIDNARLQELRAQQKQRDDFTKLMMSPDQSSAPNGGNAPAVTQAAQSQAAEAGSYGGSDNAPAGGAPPAATSVPHPGSVNLSMDQRKLAALLGPTEGPKFIRELSLKEQPTPKEPKYHFNDFTNEYGDQVTSRIDENTGTQTQFYRGGKPPDKETATEVSPLRLLRDQFVKENGREPNGKELVGLIQQARTNPSQDSYQFLPDAEGNMYVGDRRTGNLRPAKLPGAASAPPATSAASPTAQQPPTTAGPKFGRGQGGNIFTPEDASAVADAIATGKQPPNTQGLYRNAAPVRAELARRGYDLSAAQSDWNATQKHLATMNGQQQERLRQAIQFTSDSTDNIEQLYGQLRQQLPDMGFKVLNRAALTAAKNLPGKVGAAAQTLDAQIADLTSELGTVYKGGNSSTDEGLKLAAKNLSSDWNEDQFTQALAMLRKNLQIRRNSIASSAPVGASQNNPYYKGGQAAEPDAAPAASPAPGKANRVLKYNPATGQVE